MVEPDLTHVMDSTKMLPEIGCKTNVLEAARKMRECRQTAVLVFDSDRYVFDSDYGISVSTIWL